MATEDTTVYQCGDCKGFYANMDVYAQHQCVTKVPAASTANQVTGVFGEQESEAGSQDTAVWGRNATLLLIEGYRTREHLVNCGKMRKKTLWLCLQDDLKKKGYDYSANQVESRWKSLIRSLRAVLDSNSKSGSSRKTHPFEEELSFLAVRPNVSLENVISSTPESSNKRKADDADDDNDETEVEPTKPPKKQCTPQISTVLEVMNKFVSMTEDRYEKETRRQTQMHEEKMDLFRSYIDHLKKS